MERMLKPGCLLGCNTTVLAGARVRDIEFTRIQLEYIYKYAARLDVVMLCCWFHGFDVDQGVGKRFHGLFLHSIAKQLNMR